MLNDTNFDITYEGPRDSDPRMIVWTLNFTVKGFVFGATTATGLIQNSITNILNNITEADTVQFNMNSGGVGTYQEGEFVYQGYSLNNAVATAKVVSWSNNVLLLTNVKGNFVSSQSIIGATTNTNYTFNSYQLQPLQYTQIVTVPNPTDANTNTAYTYTTTVTETPNIVTPVITQANFGGDMNLNVFGVDDLLTEQENPIDLGS